MPTPRTIRRAIEPAIGCLARGLACVALAHLAACTGTRTLPAVPEELATEARIPGLGGIRQWGDGTRVDRSDRVTTFVSQIREEAARAGALPNRGRLDSLVLSGGGSDGPFGAGFLIGWTERGDRPDFQIVTGISAGALIAPFAFLGPEYDDAMRQFTLEGSTDSLVSFRPVGGLFEAVGLIDNSKLAEKLEGLITDEVVARLAEEYLKGRRLLIGTTNLDAQRPVYWRIAQIAHEGQGAPEATSELITRIIIASASIPGAFPPQFFEVEADGRRWSEMHVDGGVTHQLFFLPLDRGLTDALPPDILRFAQSGTIFIIRNTKVQSEYEPVPPGVVQITSRAVSTLIKYGGRSDIRLLKRVARDSGFSVRVASVPADFTERSDELFDPDYILALFERGIQVGRSDTAWQRDIEAPAAGQPPPVDVVSRIGEGAAPSSTAGEGDRDPAS